MLKRRLAFTLAVIGGIMTVLVGFLQDIRPLTIGYRSLVSGLVFGVCGFLLGSMIDSYQQHTPDVFKPKGQTIDIISKDDDTEIGLPATEPSGESEFRPFTAETFDHLPGKQ